MPPDPGAYAGGAPTYDNVSTDAPGTTVSSVDVFYNDLAPYGSWYNDPTYGWVFAPNDQSYVPYSNGYWTNTNYGFTWVSGDPFGWATDHYGHWVWANRWIWVPNTVWGPAWVQWREGPGYVGWAPAVDGAGSYVPDNQWRFVAARNLLAPDVRRYYFTGNLGTYMRSTAPVNRFYRHGNDVWVAGPHDDWLRSNRVDARRQPLGLQQMGRYTDAQRWEAQRRAQQRQSEWDARRAQAQNRQGWQQQQQRQAEDQRRMQEQQQRQMQQQQRQMDEQRRRDDEARRRADEEQRRQAEIQARQQQEQMRRQADDQRRMQEQQQRQADEQRRMQEQQQRQFQQQEQQRQAEEQRRMQEQQRRQADDQRRQQDEQRRQQQAQDEARRSSSNSSSSSSSGRRSAPAVTSARQDDQRRQQQQQQQQADDQRRQDDQRKRQDDDQRRRVAEEQRKPDDHGHGTTTTRTAALTSGATTTTGTVTRAGPIPSPVRGGGSGRGQTLRAAAPAALSTTEGRRRGRARRGAVLEEGRSVARVFY